MSNLHKMNVTINKIAFVQMKLLPNVSDIDLQYSHLNKLAQIIEPKATFRAQMIKSVGWSIL